MNLPDYLNQAMTDVKDQLSNQWWRLNNLYYIVDKKGNKVKFKPNWAQKYLFNNMWFLCIILKARQLGMTTFIQLFMLDCCLFNDNISAGVIAHNREDAEDFFDKKIKYAYDNLPEQLRLAIAATTDSSKQLSFSNGSSIRVGTSLRSGTLQYLHVSEFGKICAKYPDKAEEIISGSLNTVEAGQFIFIESTAEGAWGRFYDMCQVAMALTGNLTKLDFKFYFFSWWKHPAYKLEEDVEIPLEDDLYFTELENKHSVELSQAQKAWYTKKKAVQKGKMKQEFPSTPDEAFEQISEYAVYGKEIGKAIEEERITSLPINQSKPVDLFLDIGKSKKSDTTVIWFMQSNGPWFDFVDYYQDSLKTVAEYVRKVQEKGYIVGTWYVPHDAESQKDYEIKSFKDRLVEAGVTESSIVTVPRVADLRVGIDQTRAVFSACRFDKKRCADGIKALKAYSYEFDERKAVMGQPIHNWASHPADSFRQFAQGYRHGRSSAPEISERRQKALRKNSTKRNWIV